MINISSIKISSHSAMLFFILLTLGGMTASVLSGEHFGVPPLAQFTLFVAMIGIFFCGASAMADAIKDRIKIITEVVVDEKDREVQN